VASDNEKLKIYVVAIGSVAGVLTGFTAILLWTLDIKNGGHPLLGQMTGLVFIGWGYAFFGYRYLKKRLSQ
jgi:hypothetical protein